MNSLLGASSSTTSTVATVRTLGQPALRTRTPCAAPRRHNTAFRSTRPATAPDAPAAGPSTIGRHHPRPPAITRSRPTPTGTIIGMDLGHGARWRPDTCNVCPAQTLPAGDFDVSDRPGPASRYDPTAGHLVNTTTGRPECVHPQRVHPCADRHAGTDQPARPPAPAPAPPPPPDDVADLEAWFTATLRAALPESMAATLADAEAAANLRFPTRDVLAAMRRALSHELTRGVLVRQRH